MMSHTLKVRSKIDFYSTDDLKYKYDYISADTKTRPTFRDNNQIILKGAHPIVTTVIVLISSYYVTILYHKHYRVKHILPKIVYLFKLEKPLVF